MEKQTALAVQNLSLESLPGFFSLEKDEQIGLRSDAAGIMESWQQQGWGQFREAVFLARARKRTEKHGAWGQFLSLLYGNRRRAADRRLEDYEKLRQRLTDDQIDYLAEHGAQYMPYAAVPLGEVANAVHQLPAPKENKPAVLEGYFRKVGEKLKEAKKSRVLTPRQIAHEAASFELFQATNRIIRACKWKNTEQKKEFLAETMGMVMAEQGIPGKLTTGQVPVPDKFIIKRGRPPKKKVSASAVMQMAAALMSMLLIYRHI